MIDHPADLNAWRRWQDSHRIERRVRSTVGRLRRIPDTRHAMLLSRSANWSVLAVADAPSPTIARAIIDPARHLGEEAAVLCDEVTATTFPADWTATTIAMADLPGAVRQAEVLVSIGHHLPLSGAAFQATESASTRRFVVQHGLLTPHAPPLPPRSTLLAWGEDDAQFWRSGRDDVTTEVVGSQLLWQAALADEAVDPASTPVFLGQLHGAELGRGRSARTAEAFCRSTGATYRPHPAERDRMSRLQHELWRRRGIRVDDGAVPLSECHSPVVSIFSTGVLEAAAQGIPAWVTCQRPPAWLTEFWCRYGMSRWGQDPTPAPPRPKVEPALAVAQRLSAER